MIEAIVLAAVVAHAAAATPAPPTVNPAVVDAYLGSHQDTDLGTVTGRIPKISE